MFWLIIGIDTHTGCLKDQHGEEVASEKDKSEKDISEITVFTKESRDQQENANTYDNSVNNQVMAEEVPVILTPGDSISQDMLEVDNQVKPDSKVKNSSLLKVAKSLALTATEAFHIIVSQSTPHIVPFARSEGFRALKLSRLEYFKALKSFAQIGLF